MAARTISTKLPVSQAMASDIWSRPSPELGSLPTREPSSGRNGVAASLGISATTGPDRLESQPGQDCRKADSGQAALPRGGRADNGVQGNIVADDNPGTDNRPVPNRDAWHDHDPSVQKKAPSPMCTGFTMTAGPIRSSEDPISCES